MKNPDFKSRQDNVLEHIVTSYIELGMPVGSVALCGRANLDCSPATVRNIMAELEDIGLIAQPHTSAGRIPTDKGYRYYIDRLMEPGIITKEEEEKICFVFNSYSDEFEAMLESVSKLLSQISNEASLVLFPKIKKDTSKETRLFSFGWHHLFGQPEFKDVSKSSRLLKVFEEKEEFLDFVEDNISCKEVKVFVGSENRYSQIQDCSVILSGYGAHDDVMGAIGVIGPTRMPYKRVVPVIDYITNQLNGILQDVE